MGKGAIDFSEKLNQRNTIFTKLKKHIMKKVFSILLSGITEIFKEQYGVTLFEHMNHLHFEETKRLLSETNDGIIDSVYSVGFESLSAFYRFFKNDSGQSPAAYRKENAL
jgi:AraC family transcriptional regulator of adaptative response / methylphosphotriester-DNA alkyltransferase methyltransferase